MVKVNEASFKIGMLGPSRVGKTSLVTALLAESQNVLAGTGVAMRTVGRETEDKLGRNRQELEGDILAGEFSPGSLRGTVEPFVFQLRLDPGVPESEVDIELLDFPGGWLEVGTRPLQATADWEDCRSFITQCTILLIPVDAALLMEAVSAPHRKAMARLLTIVAVEQVARDWAKERNRRPAEPALVAFCPVKCESYFADNGGFKSRSAELSKRFHEAYAGVIKAVRDEAPAASVLYLPVDTIGCVELIDVEWPADPATSETAFSAAYRIREPRRISRVGVDDLMRAICKQLVAGRRMLEVRDEDVLSERAAQALQYAQRNEGFFRNVWLQLNGERTARARAASDRSAEAQEAARRVAALDGVLKQIAAGRYGPRAETP
jgi:hypothetical protein